MSISTDRLQSNLINCMLHCPRHEIDGCNIFLLSVERALNSTIPK